MRAAIVAVRGRLWLASSWRISHLGANPVRGGRPPKDRRIRGARPASAGALLHDDARELMLVDSEALNVRNAEDVIRTYVNRARTVREGLYWRIRIIHPR